jgi:hypothetical protein
VAEINLLKQSTSAADNWSFAYLFWIRLLGVVLILLIAYYAWLYITFNSVKTEISKTQTTINSEIQESLGSQDRNELLTRQLQLLSLQTILQNHVYWSQLFPVLAQDTFKTATYSSFTAETTDNTITLQASVPTLNDLDSYTQVFDLPQYYQNFSNVFISGFNQNQDQLQSVNGVSFNVKMQFNPSLIQYKSSSSN